MNYYVPKMNFSLGSESQTNKVKNYAPQKCSDTMRHRKR